MKKSSLIKKHPMLSGFLAAGLILLGVWLVLSDSNSLITVDRNDLLKAFGDAYVAGIESNGTIREFDLVADTTTLSLIDGVEFEGFAYNGQVPGPVWQITKGDTMRINLQNKLPQSTTIHFHGIRVPNAMDGVPGVTQNPVEPGGSFVYEFTPKDAGTFWFHPHVRTSEQIEKGLYGVIIVQAPDEPKYSQDLLWVVDDWRLLKDGTLDEHFNTGHDLVHDGRWGNLITVNGEENHQLTVQPGERIRLRLVNVSNGRVYKLDFDQLKAKVIAVDGMLVKETFDANEFELAPGNRLDVDIFIPAASAGQSFSVLDTFILGRPKTLGTIQVEGEVVTTSDFKTPTNPNIPDWVGGETLEPNKSYKLNVGGGGMGMMGITWAMNGKAFPDYDPFILKEGEFQTIEFHNLSARLHPMHLHGQFFKVLSRNNKAVNEPYFRDTVLVHPREKVIVGMVPLDKGSWANHCHILEHAEAGMMSIVEVK